VTDVKTEGNHLETLSDRELLEHIAARLDKLATAADEFLPHARKLMAARAKVGKMLGGKHG
jgi:hypothetical protein